ncbi:MAG: hypothetical protein QF735_06710, partial [Phycisphaeraceae bacterium]|nr:hypothetical protein [Phycisphaeraceae bacterium]
MSELSEQPPRKPVIGITMGEPAGIGPEIVVKALADPELRRLARYVIYGMNELLSYAADLAEIEPYWWRVQHDSPRAKTDLSHDVVVLDYDEFSMLGQIVHRPSKQGGHASLAFLDDALKATTNTADTPDRLDAIVRLEGRIHRRAERGSNLWYDQGLINAMRRLSDLTGEAKYSRAAD